VQVLEQLYPRLSKGAVVSIIDYAVRSTFRVARSAYGERLDARLVDLRAPGALGLRVRSRRER